MLKTLLFAIDLRGLGGWFSMERWRAVALASKSGAFPSFGVVKCRNPNEFHPGEHAGMEIVPKVIPAMPPGRKSFPAA